MLKSLKELSDNPEKRPVLVDDCVELIDSEVKSKRGFSGIAVKTAYGVVKAIKPTMMKNARPIKEPSGIS